MKVLDTRFPNQLPGPEEEVMELAMDKRDWERLRRFPHLAKAVDDFVKTGGDWRGRLPDLVIWIRRAIEDASGWKVDPLSYFGMDKDTAYEFNCWGNNSRWANVFVAFAREHISEIAPKCIELAEKHGDPDVSLPKEA